MAGRKAAPAAVPASASAPVRHRPRQRLQLRPRAVGAAVVHQHDLVGSAESGEHGVQPLAEQREAVLLVIDGYDDGNGYRNSLAHGCSAGHLAGAAPEKQVRWEYSVLAIGRGGGYSIPVSGGARASGSSSGGGYATMDKAALAPEFHAD